MAPADTKRPRVHPLDENPCGMYRAAGPTIDLTTASAACMSVDRPRVDSEPRADALRHSS